MASSNGPTSGVLPSREWAKTHGGVVSDNTNYTYFLHELTAPGLEANALAKLVATPDLKTAVTTFAKEFERPAAENVGHADRLRYATIALAASREAELVIPRLSWASVRA